MFLVTAVFLGAVMIIDPGIDIDKGYPAYDRGIEQDVFFKVCDSMHVSRMYMHMNITLKPWLLITRMHNYHYRTSMVTTMLVKCGQAMCIFQTSSTQKLRATGRQRCVNLLLIVN